MAERGKFKASVQITGLKVTFADGHTENFDAIRQEVGFRPKGRPNSIRPLQILQAYFKEKDINLLRIGGDEALANAAHFGKCDCVGSIDVPLEDSKPENIPVGREGETPASLKIDYTVTIMRVADG